MNVDEEELPPASTEKKHHAKAISTRKKKNKKDKQLAAKKEEEKKEETVESEEVKQVEIKVETKEEEKKPSESEKVQKVIEEKKEEKKVEAQEEEDDDLDDWEKCLDDESKFDKAVKVEEKFKDEDKPEEVMEEVKPIVQPVKKKEKIVEEKKEEFIPISETVAGIERSQHGYRCPILCILGHVDTGKTKLLDKIRKTKVQEGEEGGITQQIGATFFPPSKLQENLDKMKGQIDVKMKVPGMLIIDTPGHESFSNLRSRGSNLCDFAILVVDIMHGLENQTLESIMLLRKKRTPFIVALNKVDRLYGWKAINDGPMQTSLHKNKKSKDEFEKLASRTILQFAEQGLNAELYWKNNDPRSTISLVPTSAITGEGIPDLLTLILEYSQTRISKTIEEKSTFLCTVLEVKVIEGLGTTIDVILVSGEMKVGDRIVVNGFGGPIVTTIRALLTPQPLKEMRVKGEYIHHKTVRGALGVKLTGPGLEETLAGSQLYVVKSEAEVEERVDELKSDVAQIISRYVDPKSEGVCVQSSTLGSLEALLEFLHNAKIPVTAIGIGPLHKSDVLKACKSVGKEAKEEFATILVFDVKITPEAKSFAEDSGVTIFFAKIIYHLFDMFTNHVKQCVEKRKKEKSKVAIFPSVFSMVQGAVMHSKDPIIMGVEVQEGILKVGTPVAIPSKDNLRIGKVESIEVNHKPIIAVRNKDGAVAVKISGESSIMIGRHFDYPTQFCSIITRDSIEACKAYFRDELTQDDWKLMIKLKKIFGIVQLLSF
eukprot:TRINITY_DN24600_c0_g1_i2.p1 TRINITY_DN24600_c0_g1~~TRINITY_DN24600_c0_g1_i2.p1  ORF type:complete len:900 (+),score=240.83 TRINITY_DN24600_c0_g1_i2:394-2700(+)